jgi:hypothetical protein
MMASVRALVKEGELATGCQAKSLLGLKTSGNSPFPVYVTEYYVEFSIMRYTHKQSEQKLKAT